MIGSFRLNEKEKKVIAQVIFAQSKRVFIFGGPLFAGANEKVYGLRNASYSLSSFRLQWGSLFFVLEIIIYFAIIYINNNNNNKVFARMCV